MNNACQILPTHGSIRSGSTQIAEVGIAHVVDGACRAWLIRPPPAWKDHWLWHPASERVHGITIERLEREGHDLYDVHTELLKAIETRVLLSDNSWYDSRWADSLFDGSAPFRIFEFDAIVRTILGPMGHDERLRLYLAEQLAMTRYPVVHRAGSDARRLAEVIRILLQIDAPES